MTSMRSRINRNRRERVHAAELRRHERKVDGVASTSDDQPLDRETEERQWLATWEIEPS